MYVPAHFALSDAQITEVLTSMSTGELVTFGPHGLEATRVPMLVDPTLGEHGALLCHLQRNNTQWQHTATEALVIIDGPEHYVSPTWYPDGASGTVPTWDYVTVHAYGTLIAHHDPEWIRTQVSRLSDHFESGEMPWSIDDAPPEFVDRMLRAIVGVEIRLTRLQGKAKMSQNKPVPLIEAQLDHLGNHPAAAFKRDVSLPAARAKASLVERARQSRRP